MTARLKPRPGQRCECHEPPPEQHEYDRLGLYGEEDPIACCNRPPHDHDWPNHGGKLARIYWEKGDVMCYAWWCADCRKWLYSEEDGEGWPVDASGRFMRSTHCERIPGLD